MTIPIGNKSFRVLLFLGIAALFVNITLFAKTAPLFIADALYFCRQVLTSTFFQIPQSFFGIIALSLGAIIVLGLLSFFAQAYMTKRLIKELLKKKAPLPRRVKECVDSLGLTNSVYLIWDTHIFSFCYGLITPRILLTTALVSRLRGDELHAVLLHEKAHLLNRDPLKQLLGKAIATMFFFLPIFSQLHRFMNAANEIVADTFVLQSQGTTTHLRNALRKIIATPPHGISQFPGIANPTDLEIRVYSLITPTYIHHFRPSFLSIVTSMLFFAISFFVLQAPVNAIQPNPAQAPASMVCPTTIRCSKQCSTASKAESGHSSQELYTPASQYRVPPSK